MSCAVIPIPIDIPHCINHAAIVYHIPAKLIISVLHAERGKVGQIAKNKNGTYDIGPMQINSSWIPELERYGISEKEILYDACTNIKVGAWILGKKIANRNSLLTGIGDYNSHTLKHNQAYSQQIRINYTKINMLLT
jgi:soluble lytic murein transglycosylase-like protein